MCFASSHATKLHSKFVAGHIFALVLGRETSLALHKGSGSCDSDACDLL